MGLTNEEFLILENILVDVEENTSVAPSFWTGEEDREEIPNFRNE